MAFGDLHLMMYFRTSTSQKQASVMDGTTKGMCDKLELQGKCDTIFLEGVKLKRGRQVAM